MALGIQVVRVAVVGSVEGYAFTAEEARQDGLTSSAPHVEVAASCSVGLE